ncbi:hypothetical protein SeLEV6574_g01042 [Synchytrium endobioticum]|uniref:Uncharacterized protein n=1 Tax=Synchytrium endobioticum TaxID=286115 RepID=A0A507DES5_9FUNG|nr:hypothetical protein SeLEV6574_g01042 [Synchytrium endobioticum]
MLPFSSSSSSSSLGSHTIASDCGTAYYDHTGHHLQNEMMMMMMDYAPSSSTSTAAGNTSTSGHGIMHLLAKRIHNKIPQMCKTSSGDPSCPPSSSSSSSSSSSNATSSPPCDSALTPNTGLWARARSKSAESTASSASNLSSASSSNTIDSKVKFTAFAPSSSSNQERWRRNTSKHTRNRTTDTAISSPSMVSDDSSSCTDHEWDIITMYSDTPRSASSPILSDHTLTLDDVPDDIPHGPAISPPRQWLDSSPPRSVRGLLGIHAVVTSSPILDLHNHSPYKKVQHPVIPFEKMLSEELWDVTIKKSLFGV